MASRKGAEGGYTPFPCDKVKRHGRAYGWVYKAMRSGALSRMAVDVYINLSWRRNPGDGQCNPSTATIALDLGMAKSSRSEVFKAITELEAFGVLERAARFVNNKQTTNAYFLYEGPGNRAAVAAQTADGAGGSVHVEPAMDAECVRTRHGFTIETQTCAHCGISYEANKDATAVVTWRLTHATTPDEWRAAQGFFDEEANEYHDRTERFETHGPQRPWDLALRQQSDGSCVTHLVNRHRRECMYSWCHIPLKKIEEAGRPFDETEAEWLHEYFDALSDDVEH